MAPSKKEDRRISVRTVPELAPKTFWRPHSYRFQDSNTNNQHVLIKNPIASQLPTQITTTAHLNYPKTYMNYPKYNGMWCHRVVGHFPNPYSHRQLGRNPFAQQHLNYPKIDSSTNDYPKTSLTCFAFCRTVRKCVKALSENYPTKWWFFSDYPKRENNYPKVFPASNSCPRQ